MGILLLKVIWSSRHLFKRASATRKIWELKEVRDAIPRLAIQRPSIDVQTLCSIPDHPAELGPETFRNSRELQLR